MIWSEKTVDAVADSLIKLPPLDKGGYYELDFNGMAKAALAAVAESGEWKAKDAEIERLRRQVSVLRKSSNEAIDYIMGQMDSSTIEVLENALAATDKIGEE